MRLLLSCVAARPSLTAGAAEPDGPDRARVMCLMMMTFAASPARCALLLLLLLHDEMAMAGGHQPYPFTAALPWTAALP